MPDLIRQFDADMTSLETFYPVDWSGAGCGRYSAFVHEELQRLNKIDRTHLDTDGQIDWDLLSAYLQSRQDAIALTEAQNKEMQGLVPFQDEAVGLEEARVATHPKSPEESAKVLQSLVDSTARVQATFSQAMDSGKGTPSAALAYRASKRIDRISGVLSGWYREFDGFVPSFAWWCKKPFEDLQKALAAYSKSLRERGAGFTEGKDAPLIGDPIGREAFVRQMNTELLGLTPEQMVDRAERDAVWCHDELKRASAELGFGDDWKKALQKVKLDHCSPDDQVATICRIENEVIDFVTKRKLVTVEPLFRETWSWTMTSTQDEKVYPYPVYGGYKVMVPYASVDMDQKTKEQVFSGNGVHFLHNVIPHELIPGHHLQGLAAAKYASYRNRFSTPFLIEGWAFYWELRLWDLGWSKSPEDRMAMLFWRLHRCARVILTTKFHLGQTTPDEMVKYLTDEVGHEPEMAKAEVRRYLAGDYPPLYQCAYQVGAFALKDLHDEIVVKGHMSEQLFHDTVLKQGAIPVSLIARKLRSMLISHGS